MEEKKSLKISLKAGILIALVIILIIEILGMRFYYSYKRNKESKENQNMVSDSTENQVKFH